MDGVKQEYSLTVRQPLDEFIDEQQPLRHFSCDWLSDPLALGLIIFPLKIYEKMRQLRNGTNSSSRSA
jgi:hypothetical protein